MQNFWGIRYGLPRFFFGKMTTRTALGDGTVPYLPLLAMGQLQLGLICVDLNKVLIIFFIFIFKEGTALRGPCRD